MPNGVATVEWRSATISLGVMGVGQVGGGEVEGQRKAQEEKADEGRRRYPHSLRSSYQIVALR